MSEKGGDNSGTQTHTESENVLDDLMQNNVQFDEDEKPKTANEANEDDDKHSDISDNESSDSSDDSKSDEDEDKDNDAKSNKSKEDSKEKEDHSDISEDEDENITKNQEEKKTEDLKKTDKKKEPADSSDDEEKKEKKPTLASRITRPPQQTSTTSPEVKKKKGKSYDYTTKLNYLFRDARFFLVKSSVAENVDLSKVRGVWSTPPANEGRFNKAFRESRNVIMIYSVKESGRFCGFARLASESRRDGPPVPWLLPPGLSAKALGGVFKIDWICKKDLSFQKVGHLHNPWNDNKPVKIGRDGQEIEPSIAENLCKLFVTDAGIDMTPILRRSKESARRQRSRPESERSQDIPNTRPLAERARPILENRKRPYPRDGHFEQNSRPNKQNRPNQRRDFNPPMHRRQPPFELHTSHRRAQMQAQQQQQYQRSQAPAPPAVSRSYEEYLRSQGRATSGSSSSRPQRSYQDQDQDYMYDRRPNRDYQGRGSYDRSVDEFIRRNNDNRRYRDRR